MCSSKPSPPRRGEFEERLNQNDLGWVYQLKILNVNTRKENLAYLMTRTIIPYNTKLKELAKKLRQNMTFSEVKLWNEIKTGN